MQSVHKFQPQPLRCKGTAESDAIRVEAHRDNPEKLGLVLQGADEHFAPTHWFFGKLSSLVSAPTADLRQLPAPLAGSTRNTA